VWEGQVRLGGREVRLLGVDPLTAPAALVPKAMAPGASEVIGGPPLYAAPALAEAVGAVPVPGMPSGLVVTDITRAAGVLGQPQPSRLLLLPDQPLRQAPLADLGPYRIREPQAKADLSRLTESFHLNL